MDERSSWCHLEPVAVVVASQWLVAAAADGLSATHLGDAGAPPQLIKTPEARSLFVVYGVSNPIAPPPCTHPAERGVEVRRYIGGPLTTTGS
jgi:hypothetical protein